MGRSDSDLMEPMAYRTDPAAPPGDGKGILGSLNPYGAALGALGTGIGMITDAVRVRKAKRELARMGSRPKVSVPQEVMAAYQNRLKRSKMYQGFTQAETAQATKGIARSNAAMAQRAQNMGGSAQAMQTMMGNQAANAYSGLAAQSAQMNRAGQARDLSAADMLGSQVGGYQTENQRQAGGQWDTKVSTLGAQMQQGNQGISNSLQTMAGLGWQSAMAADAGDTNYNTYNTTKP
jgi:hypothetical protein